MATFEIYRDKDQWYWRLHDDEGKRIAVCAEPYLTRAGAERNVGMVREVAGLARIVDLTGE